MERRERAHPDRVLPEVEFRYSLARAQPRWSSSRNWNGHRKPWQTAIPLKRLGQLHKVLVAVVLNLDALLIPSDHHTSVHPIANDEVSRRVSPVSRADEQASLPGALERGLLEGVLGDAHSKCLQVTSNLIPALGVLGAHGVLLQVSQNLLTHQARLGENGVVDAVVE